MYISLHTRCLFCLISIKIGKCHILIKPLQENPSGGIRVVPCGTRHCIANALKIVIKRKHSFSPRSPKIKFDTMLVLKFI